MVDGSQIDGIATRIDGENLSITTDDDQTEVYKESSISDIDHPGNIAFGIGAGLSIPGIILTGWAFYRIFALEDGFAPLIFAYSLPPLAFGLPPAIWGAMTWLDSKDAIDVSNLSLQPSLFDKDGFAPGINVKLDF